MNVNHETVEKVELPAVAGLLNRFDPDQRKSILRRAQSPGLRDSYLAFEAVRRSGVVLTGESKIKRTGFEGYFQGFGLNDERIVSLQSQIGLHVRAKLKDEWTSPVVQLVSDTLKGKDCDPYALLILEEMGLFSRMRGLAFNPKMDRQSYEKYRDSIYGSLPSRPANWLYEESPAGVAILRQEMHLPALEISSARLRLSREELSGYEIMAEFGRLGHPVVRAAMGALYGGPLPVIQAREVLSEFRTGKRVPLPDFSSLI